MTTLKKKLIVLFAVLNISYLIIQPINACTVFNAFRNGKMFAATNKDWNNTNTRILFIPPSDGKYGRVYFGYQIPEGFQNVGGMNEHGLWYDGASLPTRSDIKNHYNKPTVKGELCEKALEECTTIEEVIDMYKTYYTPHWQGHSMWADKSGNSVIIEFGEKDVVFIDKQKDLQIMTNFYISDEKNHRWYNCRRYKTVDHMLNQIQDISIESFTSILDAVHRNGFTPTVFSNIYDLKNGDIYIYYYHNFQEVVKLNIHEELDKGEQYLNMPELFNGIKLLSPEIDKKNNPQSITFFWKGNADFYELYYSRNPGFEDCIPIEISSISASSNKNTILYSTLMGSLLVMGISVRKRSIIRALPNLLLIITLCIGCTKIFVSPNISSNIEHHYTVNNLTPNTQYYWKIVALGESGINSESSVRTFKTDNI
jgi:hypothetical protein